MWRRVPLHLQLTVVVSSGPILGLNVRSQISIQRQKQQLHCPSSCPSPLIYCISQCSIRVRVVICIPVAACVLQPDNIAKLHEVRVAVLSREQPVTMPL